MHDHSERSDIITHHTIIGRVFVVCLCTIKSVLGALVQLPSYVDVMIIYLKSEAIFLTEDNALPNSKVDGSASSEFIQLCIKFRSAQRVLLVVYKENYRVTIMETNGLKIANMRIKHHRIICNCPSRRFIGR